MKTTLSAIALTIFLFSSCKKSDSTPNPAPAKTVPVVTTSVVTNITRTSATGNGVVVSRGSDQVSTMGVAYTTVPTVFDNGYFQSAGFADSGPFSCTLTPLLPNTTYYYQAYAANVNGFGLGVVLSFKTAP